MHKITSIGLLALLAAPHIQDPAPQDSGFATAIEAARNSFSRGERRAALAALRQAILVVQQQQRAAILAVLPQPAGFRHEDLGPPTAATDPFAAEIAALGLDVERRYRGEGDVRFDIEISSDSPLVETFARLLDDPEKVAGSGGSILTFGANRALAKFKEAHGEVTIVLRERHIVKVTSDGMTQAALTAIVNQPVVERIERELTR